MLNNIFLSTNDFRRVTAKQIALENGIEYISNAETRKLRLRNGKHANRFYARKNRYILLHPPNDGTPKYPFEWYVNFYGKPQMIMYNQTAFKCITNLSDILFQMVQLYSEYIDDNIFIASTGFAIKLEDEIKPDYHGRASLVLTKDSIRNSKVKLFEIDEAKKYFINDFLDHYIGWNFGAVIAQSPKLEKALLDFNDLVINKDLREYAGNGFNVHHSKDIVHYNLKIT